MLVGSGAFAVAIRGGVSNTKPRGNSWSGVVCGEGLESGDIRFSSLSSEGRGIEASRASLLKPVFGPNPIVGSGSLISGVGVSMTSKRLMLEELRLVFGGPVPGGFDQGNLSGSLHFLRLEPIPGNGDVALLNIGEDEVTERSESTEAKGGQSSRRFSSGDVGFSASRSISCGESSLRTQGLGEDAEDPKLDFKAEIPDLFKRPDSSKFRSLLSACIISSTRSTS